MKYILITGVSTGIGYTCTDYFLKKGYFVFGSVRKKADGEKLQQDFPNNFKPLIFDVTDGDAIERAVLEVQAIVGDKGLAGLVNNAGIAVSGPMQHLPIDRLEHQLNVNVIGMVRVTQAFLPLLGAIENCPYPSGRIIQISSVAGTVSSPFMGAYSASKYAMEAISDALRRELAIFGIKVVIIQPGPIKSEIWTKTVENNKGYEDTSYGVIMEKTSRSIEKVEKAAIPASEVADKVWAGMELDNPKTRYIVAKEYWKMKMASKLPDKWIDNMASKPLIKIMNKVRGQK